VILAIGLALLLPALAMFAIGAVGIRVARPRGRAPEYVSNRDVYLSVTLAWTLAAILGGTPFLVEGTFHSLLDSSFEAMSGFTTTGATLLSTIEAETPSILFWRSMTQWLGGIGIVVLFVAVAPLLGVGAARLIGAEMSGLTQPRLTPRIADTAKALITIYLAISMMQVVCLLVAGMGLYDAVVHTFTTFATGGFSPKTSSIAFYDSPVIEAIIALFMVASGVSFSLYYLPYTRRNLSTLLDRELVTYLAIIVAAIIFVWGILVTGKNYEVGQALRDSAFSVVSIITTTGFVTADYDRWDTAAKTTMVLLMFVGGCAGSTAGGIKVIRMLIVFRTILQDIFRIVHPRAVTPLTIGGSVVPEAVRLAVLGLFAAWVTIFGAATLLVALQGDLTLTTSATAVAATLNVVGPGLGQIGASESYEIVDPLGRFVLTVCMLLGRLEIFTVVALLSPAFWKR